METAFKTDEVTTNSQLVGLLPGDPAKVNLVDCATGRNGLKRHFSQQVSVLDKDLFARLQKEANIGEHIRVTIVNEYHKTKIVTYVKGFQKVVNTAPNGTNNGTNGAKPTHRDVSQIPITMSTIEPVILNKTKARK